MIKEGGLKKYYQTKWTTAFDCISSILKYRNYNPDYLKKNIKDIITRCFSIEIEEL
ncbi:hypothetical protein RhiirA5_436440 [Rhizophagus irregularis]|uniref:Uncharacterized protein n=1 Tax=Rhizophagus irregularis TaxID=588596 RepID=A0A2N0NLZ5_9GLOM|nr:hypothetical protein RhiirA5_436440 [Rhizophagus irregularis]